MTEDILGLTNGKIPKFAKPYADVVRVARDALGDRIGQFVPGHPLQGLRTKWSVINRRCLARQVSRQNRCA
ncbi:hypothetical protein QWA_17305, partial [Alcaligenes faecalis subsp. faecalis NCIB 8687]